MIQERAIARKLAWTATGCAVILVGIFSLVRSQQHTEKAITPTTANVIVPAKQVEPEESVAEYGYVPNLELKDQNRKIFHMNDLRGHVWIADLIFTHCAGTCPVLTAKMAALQKDLPKEQDIRFVSVSVDPNNDSPETLSTYAKNFNADLSTWKFLTGPIHTVYKLSKEGFHLALDSAKDDQKFPITHSERFVLVDAEGKIRGYYNGTSEEELQKLKKDIAILKRS